MDVNSIFALFNDQTTMKQYVGKQMLKEYNSNSYQAGGIDIKFTCTDFMRKLIDFSQGYINFKGQIISTTGTPLTGTAPEHVSIQTGAYSIFKDIKISLNTTQVEHNKLPGISTSFLNFLEYSQDYAETIAIAHAFAVDDEPNHNSDAVDIRNDICRSDFDATIDGYKIDVIIPLNQLSQFFRRLDFPLMNQLVEIELTVDPEGCILRNVLVAGAVRSDTKITMDSAVLFVPQVTLPTDKYTKFLELISSGKMVKTLTWDAADYKLTDKQVAAGDFSELLDSSIVGVRKLFAMIQPHYKEQIYIQTTSDVAIRNFNLEIDGENFYPRHIESDQEAYQLVKENFNMNGKDYNTGSLLPYHIWKDIYRLYALDLSHQAVFESDPKVSQKIRFFGNTSAAGTIYIILMKNKTTIIDYSEPSNTRTIS